MKNLGVIAALVILSTGGCISEKQSNRIQKTKALPPLPGYHLQSAKRVSTVGEFSAAQERRLVVRWENQESPFATNYKTRVESSVDLTHWQSLAEIPYQPQGEFSLTNSDPCRFFRVCNVLRSL